MPVEELVSNIRYWASESLQFCRSQKVGVTGQRQEKWTCPEGEILKVNIDGAFKQEDNTGGWGFVIRDGHAYVRGSGAGRLKDVGSAIQAEAVACLEALHAAATWGMMKIQVESDCQILVRALKSTEYDLTSEGIMFRESRLFARQNFISCCFFFAPRECNKLAHALAAFGSRKPADRQRWAKNLPDDVIIRRASRSAEPV